MRRSILSLFGLSFAFFSATSTFASPVLNSRLGAAYTIYLDFTGFNYSGTWSGNTPGATAAYGTDAQITDTWARTAEKYAGFNVNVTTVDPSIAAGKNGSDATRQAYYDQTAQLMHTVVGGAGAWTGGTYGGISFVGTTANAYSGSGTDFSNGYHTNWIFADNFFNSSKYLADATAHENGHGLGLNHQSDYHVGGTTTVNEYSDNNGATGNGSYAPNMGVGYSSQRGTWRIGKQNNGVIQNDVQKILADPNMTLVDDGIGHTFTAATALPLNGTLVNTSLAKGFITPTSSTNPVAIGINNYKKDYFKFTMSSAGNITLKVSDGSDWITSGTLAAGATLRSKLNIYTAGATPNFFGTATEAVDTLSETYTGNLAAGDYFAEVTSYGGTHRPSIHRRPTTIWDRIC